MKMEKEYTMGEGTAIFFNGENEIVFRKGVWNYEEAILNISQFDEELQENLLNLFRDLSKGETITDDELFTKYNISEQLETVLTLLDELGEQEYINNGYEDHQQRLIKSLIGGKSAMGGGQNGANTSGTLLISDTKPVVEQMMKMAEGISMDLKELDEAEIDKIRSADLTSRTDALENERAYKEITQILAPYGCVLICLQRPHIRLLRNLNRALLRLRIPFIVCMIDGPFLSIMTIKGYETGCFECYETRVQARLENMSAYRNYVEKTSGHLRKFDNTAMSPILASISSLGLYDALLISTIHRAKLAGRVLNIYLPLLEIQTQDLLRVPFCSACGHIAKAQYDEMYTSSEKIVEKMIENVEIEANLQ